MGFLSYVAESLGSARQRLGRIVLELVLLIVVSLAGYHFYLTRPAGLIGAWVLQHDATTDGRAQADTLSLGEHGNARLSSHLVLGEPSNDARTGTPDRSGSYTWGVRRGIAGSAKLCLVDHGSLLPFGCYTVASDNLIFEMTVDRKKFRRALRTLPAP